MINRTEKFWNLVRAVGMKAAINIVGRRLLGVAEPVAVHAAHRSIVLRPKDSDLFVAAQIFGTRDYDIGNHLQRRLNDLALAWKKEGKNPVVVDGGANVGYSSLYFAEFFPDATIIAVEPDDEAYSILEKNCAGLDRIVPIHAALWKHDRGVTVRHIEAASWGSSVVNGGLTPSYTLGALLKRVPEARPLVLKLDIEGAEREVCEEAADIVREFPCIMIEPHDYMQPGASCLSPLYAAIAGKDMDTLVRGENIMFVDSFLCAGIPGPLDKTDPVSLPTSTSRLRERPQRLALQRMFSSR